MSTDASGLPRSTSSAGACYGREVPITMAILRQGWSATSCCGGALYSGRVYGVRSDSRFSYFWLTVLSFNLSLDTRLEYLTLAVGNAKSHPVSVGGRHETAIAFLTDLEEKLEVAQVQLELYNTLLPRRLEPEVMAKFNVLSKGLYNITEVWSSLTSCSAVHA